MLISNRAQIGENVTIKSGAVIEDNVIIGDNCYIDYNAIIKENVNLGKGSFVGAQCILGEYLYDFYHDFSNKSHELVIGDSALIRSGCILYGDSKIGANFQTGHNVTIREKSLIGDNVNIGTLSDIQGACSIGNYVHIHSNVHIGQKSTIKDFVWIFPYVVLTNDPMPPSDVMLGIVVEKYACVCAGTVILPGVRIGEDALVGAGAIVTKNVENEVVAVGNPARSTGSVFKIKDQSGESHYPWRYSFDRGTPWQGVGFKEWSKNNKS